MEITRESLSRTINWSEQFRGPMHSRVATIHQVTVRCPFSELGDAMAALEGYAIQRSGPDLKGGMVLVGEREDQ